MKSFLFFLAQCHHLCLHYGISLDGQTNIVLGPSGVFFPISRLALLCGTLMYQLSHSYLLSANYLICHHLTLIKGILHSDSLSAHPPKLVSPFSSSGLSWPLGPGGWRKPWEPGSTSQFHCPPLSHNLTPFTAQGILSQTFSFSQISIHPLPSVSSFDLPILVKRPQKNVSSLFVL